MTPGEDTRNFYRNQGIAFEQKRIIKLLEERRDFIAVGAKEMGMGEVEDLVTWASYFRSAFLEIERFIEVVRGELPVESSPLIALIKGEK